MNLDFTGKSILVTGAARGIGLDIAAAFHARGAKVALVDVLDEVHRSAEDLGDGAKGYTVDVTDAGAVKALVKEVVEDHGGIDVLVNNAGITRDALLSRMSPEDFDLVMKVNLYGTFNLTQAATRPMMKARSGRIVNIASVVGLHGNIGQANYSASKAGVVALTQTTAKELAPRNITVNVLAPGFIETDMTAVLTEETRRGVQQQVPLGRFGQPEDIAEAALFLASPTAGYVTGQVLTVDGGLAM